MSAIAGIIRFDGAPVPAETIHGVTAALSARGPDAQGHWIQDHVALGHCLLRTTPEARNEQQPLFSANENLVLVMDGRLDNREELARELKARGIMPRDHSDAELVLGAFLAWAEDSPEHLLGDFVYAVYDKRRRSLFVARDHVGGRPLYFTQNPHFFAFASDDESLLQIPGVSREPCADMIAHLFLPELVDFYSNQSWLRDIRLLPAAHVVRAADNGQFQLRSYWQFKPGEPSRYRSDRECAEAFLDVFGQAVHCRMRSNGDIATLLSGGLDSSAIATAIARWLPKSAAQRFLTYSTVMENDPGDLETACIRQVSERTGSESREVLLPSLTGVAGMDDLLRIAWQQAHPVDSSILLASLMFVGAAKDGVRTLMHGVSGDLATWVPQRYARYLLADGQWRRAWAECRAAHHNHNVLRESSAAVLLLKAAWSAFAPGSIQHSVQRIRARSPDLPDHLFNPSFAATLRLQERLTANAQCHAVRTRCFSTVGEDHARVLAARDAGLVEGLTGYEHAGGKYGIELRDPWSDRRVLQFFLDLPIEHKIRDGWTKTVVRNALEPTLGPAVTRRQDKGHLGRRIKARLMSASRAQLDDVFENQLGLIEIYLNPDKINGVYRRYQRTENNADREFLFTVMTLVKWIERITS